MKSLRVLLQSISVNNYDLKNEILLSLAQMFIALLVLPRDEQVKRHIIKTV
jgi:hypothetical protein